ncbi:MAG: DUF1146 family protein [Bacilli bacterium]|nr:DUF1146 family protein [Bacilli bacterium]
MFDYLVLMWFFVIFIPLTFACYHAFMAVDFSKFFRPNSTWQIKLLTLVLSISLAFIVAFAFAAIAYAIKLIIGSI